ncbi:bifunctional riboflavin kinase/FAD synthetase [Halalkalibacter urbisdiaboli]|uniref:bifunctional riboflavin kinase/FAD synthetase n=1 Tax=Halalkalibacter urbisdiaboli TaxID=1960589 RepID=UPI000B42E15C|nr:bifunctional riboflavin kinase/FAD synthetase [Halalkalibacter urbisdiaboli]
MDIIYLQHPIEASTLKKRKSVMALGYFDGVHNGHKQVIQTASQKAKDLGVDLAVMTFDPHPKEVLRQHTEPLRFITPLSDKIERINKLDVDTLYVVRFTEEFAKLTPQEFVDDYLIGLDVKHVVAGFDFTYGALGKGTMETLPFHARNQFSQTTVAKFKEGDKKVSSTEIRSLLNEGRVEDVSLFLGNDYSVRGVVVHGEKRGRTIGFPTANIELSERYIIPKIGVYAVEMKIRGKLYQGVCNIGYKPTFHNERAELPNIEVHLFSFYETIYGEEVEVIWKKRIRAERKFSGIDELITQIKLDREKAVDFFSTIKNDR